MPNLFAGAGVSATLRLQLSFKKLCAETAGEKKGGEWFNLTATVNQY